MDNYCVVYEISGICYRFRCLARNGMDACMQCCDAMGVEMKDIIQVNNKTF